MLDSIRLAAIYKKDYIFGEVFKAIALVEFDEARKHFKILNGDYENTSDASYDLLEGDPNYIYGDHQTLYKKEREDNIKCEYDIYIFDKQFICSLVEKYNINEETVYYKIAKLLECVSLEPDKTDENKFISKKNEHSFSLNDDDIRYMLYGGEKRGENKQPAKFQRKPYDTPITHSLFHLIAKELETDVISASTKKSLDIDIDKVIKEISSRIVGQEQAIQTLVTNIYHNQRLIDSLENNEEASMNELDTKKVSILLDGTTGTGKTAIAKEIARILKLPIVRVNANSFSQTGYVGPTITDILEKLIKEANGDIELAKRGIVFIDEIDKIAEQDSTHHSMKLGVQQELLGFMSGSSYEVREGNGFFAPTIDFDTSKLTFILSGAFTDIKNAKIKENNKKTLGFETLQPASQQRTYVIDSQDYIDYGLMEEFFGRIKVITATKTYNVEDLKKILLESKISPLKGLEDTCKMYGYSGITYNEELIQIITEEAYKMGTGARALQNLISGVQDVILMDLITQKYDLSKPVELTPDLLQQYKNRNIRTY